jgi:hypothetical protein
MGQVAATCGNGVVDPGEQCDGDACCTPSCAVVANGNACAGPRDPCVFRGVCLSGACVGAGPLAEGDACDDGNPCTVGETCHAGTCQAETVRCDAVLQPRIGLCCSRKTFAPKRVVATVTCVGEAGGACSAAAFASQDAATAAAAAETNDTTVCNFARQITHTVHRPLDVNGAVTLQLRLNKLASRALRKLPDAVILIPVCTNIEFPNGDALTLVDVVRLARQ